MRSSRAGALVLVAWAVVLVGASACASTAGERPGALPTHSTSGTPVDPDGTIASRAADPKQAERAEVEAAVGAYYAAMDVAFRTGQTMEYKRITTDECACRSLVREIREIFDNGVTRDAGVALQSVSAHSRAGRTFLVESWARLSAYQVVDRSGTVIGSYEAEEAKRLIGLTRVGDDLLVDSVTFQGRRDS